MIRNISSARIHFDACAAECRSPTGNRYVLNVMREMGRREEAAEETADEYESDTMLADEAGTVFDVFAATTPPPVLRRLVLYVDLGGMAAVLVLVMSDGSMCDGDSSG